MSATGVPSSVGARVFWATVAALAAFNLARGAGLFGSSADWVALALSFVVVVVALRVGLGRGDLGLGRDRVRSGLVWGGVASGLVLLVVVVAAIVPATSGFLHDDRAAIPWWRLVLDVVVGIGLLTVVPEELLFRGVLLGSAIRRWGTVPGVVASSLVFGLWHVLPTLSTAGGNEKFAEADASMAGRLGLVVGAVVTTALAGAVFSWLRLRSASIVAPMLAHLSTNGVALVVAWVVLH